MRRENLTVSLVFVLCLLGIHYRQLWGWIPALLLAAAVHEFGHLSALYWFGLRVESIRPDPRGLCIRYCGACANRVHILTALAGPVLGLLYAFALRPFCTVPSKWPALSADVSFLLSAFNLLPILPLDGGQVFLRLCQNWLGVRKGEKLCAAVGGSLTAALLLGGLWFALIRHASAPLAAGIWLLLAENDGGALVKNGEVL